MTEPTGLLAGRRAAIVGLDEIGAGIVTCFAREGARLALVDVAGPAREDALVAAREGAAVLPADVDSTVSIGEATIAATRALGGLDILVCNLLSTAEPRALEQLDDTAIDRALRSVQTTFAAMRAALSALRDSGRGRIVLVGHRYGESVSEGLGAYNSAAWGLIGLARTAAVEWGQFQIATNVLLPLAQTVEFEAARTRRPKVIDLLVSQLPLRRVGDPVDDVGGAAVFLASDAVCFVNGQVVCADGGQQIAGPVLNPARFA
jgi:NAD(P)-dependent dehydrogenase (short-subunit alcohol dehydrogenase family)